MAKVIAAVPDLLFGSKLESALTSGGFDCELIASADAARAAAANADLLVVDLTDADFGGVALVAQMGEAGELGSLQTLGFYSHVEPEVKAAATEAGFDLVVPRSRINREGAELAAKLLAGA
jgi:PleD family two-component response regulator